MDRQRPGKFEDFYKLVVHTHHIANTEVTIGYADVHGDLLPINNDDNFCKAVSSANPLLRVFIQKRGTGGRGSWSSSRNEDRGRGSGSSCKNEVRGGGRARLRVFFMQKRGTGGVAQGLHPATRYGGRASGSSSRNEGHGRGSRSAFISGGRRARLCLSSRDPCFPACGER